MHYWRLRRHGSFDLPPRAEHPRVACRGGGCTASISAQRQGSGLCKRCYRRQWYLDHRDHERTQTAQWRTENREYDRTRWGAYYSANATRLREATRRHYRDNHAEALAKSAAYREANREAIQRREAERRRTDPRWAARNRANAARRRVTPTGNRVDYAAILTEHGMTCHICGGPIATRSELHFDHVVPLARGGEHAADNIRPAHARCNLRKGTRLLALRGRRMTLTVNTLRALAEGVGQRLADDCDPLLSIKFQTSGKYTAGQRGIYLAKLPAAPDEVIVLSPRQLTASPTLADAEYGLQVRFRGTTDPRTVWAMVSAVRDVLLGNWPTVLPSGLSVSTVTFAGGTRLPDDEAQRAQWTDNYVFAVGEHRARPF